MWQCMTVFDMSYISICIYVTSLPCLVPNSILFVLTFQNDYIFFQKLIEVFNDIATLKKLLE